MAEVALIEAMAADVLRSTGIAIGTGIFLDDGRWCAGASFGVQPRDVVRTKSDRWHVWRSPPYDLPSAVQSDLIERLGAPWPRCPEHGRHPLEYVPQGHREGPTFVFEEASWRCPLLPMVGARIGSLPDPEPYVDEPLPDGTIRWWLDGGGFGAIADSGGDVWFLWASVEGRTGWPRFREGERVAYEVDEGSQGAYRRARRVRKIGA